MGHERLPLLPRSEKWRDIVSDVALTATNECTADEVVRKTTKAIDSRFRRLHLDHGVQDAFSFLLALSVAARSKTPEATLAKYGINLDERSATPLALAQVLSSFMEKKGASLEYSELAKSAAVRALAKFFRQESLQRDIFDTTADPFVVWRKASDGSGFSVLARQFFCSLTTEYLRYFLDREASAVLLSVEAREAFQNNLEDHIDRITRHSFEVSKIAQSFAAGWYNKNATEELPCRRNALKFLAIALNKIRDALRREEA